MDDNDDLNETLSNLTYKNLEGRVTYNRMKPVGCGGQGYVYMGTLRPAGSLIAVKELRMTTKQICRLHKVIAKEIRICSGLKHPNIVTFLGFTIKNGFPLLISEWVENGTLEEFLEKNTRVQIEHIALGIAKGLRYLHDCDVIHSDLKSSNILMSRMGEPKISDFGLSRMTNYSQQKLLSSTPDGSKGTVLWMAPELFGIDDDSDVRPSKASDMWAYGMVVYEIVTKQRPYHHMNVKNDAQALIIIAIRKQLPEFPESLTNDREESASKELVTPLMHLSNRCWSSDPKLRITSQRVVRELLEYNDLLASSTVDEPEAQPRAQPNQQNIAHENGSDFRDSPSSLCQPDYDDKRFKKLKLDYEHLNLDNNITLQGNICAVSGGRCDIHRGTYKSTGLRCAIKRPRKSPSANGKFLLNISSKNLEIWAKFNHPNVTRLDGFIYDNKFFSSDGNWPMAFVYIWQGNGTVLEYLQKYPQTDVGQIAFGIAKGLQYLHNELVVHCNLKSYNVLISSNGIPLISGFSSVRTLTDEKLYSEVKRSDSGVAKNSIRWLSPELLLEDERNTKSSDMWALGMTICEIITRKLPYAHLTDVNVAMALHRCELPERPDSLNEAQTILWKLCQRCWAIEPQKRKTAEQAVNYLDVAFG